MAKKLDEKTIVNELHGESAFFRPSPTPLREIPSPHVTGKHKKKVVTQQGANNPAIRLRDEAADKNASQPLDQSTARSVDQSTRELKRHPFDMSPVLSRPKSFYITEKQDEDLDILVKKLADKVKGRVEQKIDRSVVTRLILESTGLTSNEIVESLAQQLTSRLVSQLTR